MKTITGVTVALFAMTGVAFAQPAAKAPAPAPKAPAVKKAPDATKPAPPAMEKPKPAAELADMAKAMTGTWRCKGEGMEMDGSKKAMTATNRTKLDLDKWWIVDTFDGRMGVGPKATSFKFVAYTTYDAANKKWRRYMIDNMGGHMIGTSDGMKDNKMTFHMDAWSPMGSGQFRDYVDTTDAKKTGVKFWGEMSMDKGKTWMKAYEMTCKK